MKKVKNIFILSTIFYIIFMVLISSAQILSKEIEYPNRPITVLVMFAPGGLVDVSSRLLVDRLEKNWMYQLLLPRNQVQEDHYL